MATNSDIVNEISKHGSYETGHAKNVANFEKVVDFCVGYGTTYNPSKATIKLAALQTLLTNAKTALTSTNANLVAWSNAVAARDLAFEPLSKLVTKIVNAIKATDTSQQVIDNAKTYARKLQGRRAVAIIKNGNLPVGEPVPGAEILIEQEEKHISASQMSFDNRLDNLDKLIKLLSSVTTYAPNEAELKTTALTTLINDLKTKNSAVLTALVSVSNSRISRNDILYKENTGLVDVAFSVKAYIKSIFGATSPQYKQISKLAFKRVK